MSCENNRLDIAKINYDLALIYAKASLEKAMHNNAGFDNHAPLHINHLDYLAEQFNLAWEYYSNVDHESESSGG